MFFNTKDILKKSDSKFMRKRKMIKIITNSAVLFSVFIFSTVYGQTVSLKGRVVDDKSTPVQGATVKLSNAQKSLTTNSDGKFVFDITSVRNLRNNSVLDGISFKNGILSFNVLENQKKVNIEIFDTKGQRVQKVLQDGTNEGTYNVAIFPGNLPVAMYIVKLQIGDRLSSFNILNLKNQTGSFVVNGQDSKSQLMKQTVAAATAVDVLEISKNGYQTVKKDITSYSTDLSDVILISNEIGLPPVVNGKTAKTTRYWDCCKPHCGWNSNMRMCDKSGNTLNNASAQSGCNGGPAYQCWDYAPIEVNSKVSYGWAAFNNSGTQCGDCFQLDFQGALSGKQMIVQVINIGDGGTDAFDLLIPGGGVGAFNGCSSQWGSAPLGVQYGGFHSTCGDNATCIRNMCNAAFGDKKDLMRGCDWYINWFKMTSNPQVQYVKVSCPQAIKSISNIGN